jgi:predicted dehydrogenase
MVGARMRGGALVQSLAADRTGLRNELTFYGEEGSLRVDLFRFDGIERAPIGELPGAPATRLRKLFALAPELAGAARDVVRGGLFTATYEAEWRGFADAVRAGSPPRASFEDGRAALAVALAAAASAETGTPAVPARSGSPLS